MPSSVERTPEPAAPVGALALGTLPAPTFISARDDDLARDMACFLWESSRLRHGLFTPPEFILLVSARLREYLTTHRPNVASETRGSRLPNAENGQSPRCL